MSAIFPCEVIALFAHDRHTLVAIRCSCRQFATMTAPGRWQVRVLGGGANDWIEILYRGHTTWTPTRYGDFVTIFAGDDGLSSYIGYWAGFHSELRRRYIFECSLVEIDPVVPAVLYRQPVNPRAICNELRKHPDIV